MQLLAELSGQALLNAINASQFDPQSTGGFYESYFLRANHPTEPRAFWIRYTLFCPRGSVGKAVGQLWGIYFDGTTSDLASVKQAVPFSACSFSRTKLDVQIGQARLDGACLQGMAASEDTQFSWNLAYRGESPPSFLLPLEFYSRGFPKAKVVTGIPLADYTGCINLNGKEISVDGWRGSQNHNWGPRHTDRYAWGQVAGFDGNLDAFLECSTARLRFGPVWTPWFTNLVLRIPGREFHLNSLTQSLRNRARYRCFDWTITSSAGPVTAIVTFTARSDMFVGLGYDDPPGGKRTCLNTKLAACSVQIIESGKQAIALSTSNRAAFEILTTTESHGLELSA